MRTWKMIPCYLCDPIRLALFFFLMATSTALAAGSANAFIPQSPTIQSKELLAGLQWIRWTVKNNPDICVLRIDPQRYRFRVLNFLREGVSEPLKISDWIEKSKALAVFNAGQYYPDFSYMGLLISGGKKIQGRLHRLFQALFLAEPLRGDLQKARILDLAEEEFDPEAHGYLEVAQSFMLLDRWKNIRVRRTPNMAARTILAEETGGNLLLFLTQGPYTLWDLAEIIRDGPFSVLRAMSMDGGEEAQLVLRTGDFSYPPLSEVQTQGATHSRALPTVIAVYPRD